MYLFSYNIKVDLKGKYILSGYSIMTNFHFEHQTLTYIISVSQHQFGFTRGHQEIYGRNLMILLLELPC